MTLPNEPIPVLRLAVNPREPVAAAELTTDADISECPIRDRRELLYNPLHSRRQVQGADSGGCKLFYRETGIAGLVVPAEVQQFGKPGAFEQVAGCGDDPGLEPRPQIGGRLDAPVDLFLDPAAEPRDR